jgi:hypothetical protein
MNKSAAFYLTMILALAPLAGLRAAVVFDVNPYDTHVHRGPYDVYTFTFRATSPGGVVAGFAGNLPGNNGFNAMLIQQPAPGGLPTPTNDLNAVIDESVDTQFLISQTDILSASRRSSPAPL